jgi:hypothetical protein
VLIIGGLVLGAACGVAAIVSVKWRHRLSLPLYALIIQAASLVGVTKGIFGVVSATWTTAPRLVMGESSDGRSGR